MRSDGGDAVSAEAQLASLQRLLGLAMLMTGSGEERRILDLVASAVPSFGRCRLDGAYLGDAGWELTAGALGQPDVRRDVEAQFGLLNDAGGALALPDEAWAWAYPMHSLDGNFGFFVVGAERVPAAVDRSMLQVLAQQSGIALANARLHARERASAVELLAANAALADTVAALERSQAVHERLNRVAVAGEGEDGIARAVHELTGHPVAIEDRHGNLRAWAGPDRPDPYPKAPADQHERTLARSLGAGGAVRDGARLVVTVHTSRDILGLLSLADPRAEAGEQEHVALEYGATVLAVELAHLQLLAETEIRLGRDLVEELLTGTDDQTALTRAQALGYDLARPHRVVAVEPRGDVGGDAFFHAVRRAARDLAVGSLLVSRRGVVVVVADPDSPWDAFRQLVADESGSRCRVGVGGICGRPIEFPRSYDEALLALRMQDVSTGGDAATAFDDLGIYQILAEVADGRGVQAYVRHWLGPLLDYDTENRSDLVMTLFRYVESGGRYDAAARALAVHRSTLKYRLRRIREISGHDLGDPDSRFNLQLATRAWQTQNALRRHPDQASG